MRKLIALNCLIVALAFPQSSNAATDLVALGSSTFTVDGGFTDLSYTQSTTNLTLGVPFLTGTDSVWDILL